MSRPLFLVISLLVAAPAAAAADDARALAERIDALVAARLTKEGVTPAPRAEDAEFFRRLSLDVNGRVPSVVQLRDFLDDRRPDKRWRWIDELLAGPDNEPLYVNHFANVWRRTLLSNTTTQPVNLAGPLDAWLRKQLRANAPYDRMVRGLLTDPEANGFFAAHENKPENVAAATARLFLGVKLECAQCHNHPFAKWTRQQFWEQAAFFASLAPPRSRVNALAVGAPREEDNGPARIKIADSDHYADARFLDGSAPAWQPGQRPRTVLADWITRRDNPWFARAAVNRLWHHFFGVGLIDPVDGLGVDDNAPSHPELLDELAAAFISHKYDLKYLMKAIVGSQTYQRTSRQTQPGQANPRLFARAHARGLSAEQLLDSLTFATGYRPSGSPGSGPGLLGADTLASGFLARFDELGESPIDAQTSIPQALLLMNGKLVEEATSPEKSRTLASVLGGGSRRTTARRIEELFLVTLSRRPRPEELARFVKYVEAGDPKQGLRDVFWALLNSTEFVLNH